MKDLLQKYVNDYSFPRVARGTQDNELRNVNNPIVFLFIGDGVKDVLLSLKKHNKERWQNSSGVFYFHVYQTEDITNEKNLFSVQLPASSQEQIDKRASISSAFYQDEKKLNEFNSSFRQLSASIAEKGVLFSSLQKVNICVITAVEDPANILIQEITLLLKRIMEDNFKSVETDLFALLNEKQESDSFAYNKALGISFIKEMDAFQKEDNEFKEDLLVVDGQYKMSISHSRSVFDLVYILSDKNENGLINHQANQKNVDIISNVLYLKNRKINKDYNEKMEIYNNANFRRSIQGNTSNFTYSSVGFSKIQRPNKAIALHAAHYFFKDIKEWVTQKQDISEGSLLKLFELTENSFQTYFREWITPVEDIWNMSGYASPSSSFKKLKKMTVKEAEADIFGDTLQNFFVTRIKEPVEEKIKENENQLREKILKNLYNQVIHNEKYGLYCAYLWTSESTEISIIKELNKLIKETKKMLSEAELELEQHYQQRVESCDFKWSFLPFCNKKNLHRFLNFFFEKVYGVHYRIVKLKTKLTILNEHYTVLTQSYLNLREKLEKIEEVDAVLTNAANESLSENVDLCENIPDYYAMIVAAVTAKLKETYGSNLYGDDYFLGNLYGLLEDSSERLLSNVLFICSRNVLCYREFHQNFEEELLVRTLFRVHDESSHAHTKDELFKDLYQKLDEHSAIQIDVYNYSQELSYEEKYYFGDFYSQFLKYVLHIDEDSGLSKVGCVHEKAASGIEKLALLGGFHLDDLYYYRNGETYYNLFLEHGHVFHVKEEAKGSKRTSKHQLA